MQFPYLIAILATLGLAQAQLPNLPSCSLNCFLSALQNDGCSSVTNFTCHCANPSLVGAITPCVQSACDLSDQSSVSNAVTSVCSSASVPISIPPVTGAGTTTTTGSAATATSSGSSATESGSTTPSRTSGSSKSSGSVTASSSGTGGAGGGGGASSTSGGTSGAPASTSTGTGTTSTGTTGTTTGTTTGAPQATGAAGSVSVSFVGTGLFALGVAALFAL